MIITAWRLSGKEFEQNCGILLKIVIMAASFAQVADLWKADKRQYIKKSSYSIYLVHLNRHLLPFFGGDGIPDAARVQQFVNDRLAAGLAANTIRTSLLVLRMILDYGESQQLWPHLSYKVHFPTSAAQVQKVDVLSKEQQKALSAYLQENLSFRNLALLICLYSGLRIGEVCALTWGDLDLAAGEIHVRKTLQRIFLADGDEKEYALVISTPKTASSVRDIPLARNLAKMIRPLKKLVRDDCFVASNAPDPIEPRYLRDYFSRLLKTLGLPRLKFHALRHTFATRCIESGCDYKTVSAILGHASLATTMDIYVHPGHDNKKRCIDRMARLLG